MDEKFFFTVKEKHLKSDNWQTQIGRGWSIISELYIQMLNWLRLNM